MSRRKFVLSWQHPALGREAELDKTQPGKSISQPARILLRGKKNKKESGWGKARINSISLGARGCGEMERKGEGKIYFEEVEWMHRHKCTTELGKLE